MPAQNAPAAIPPSNTMGSRIGAGNVLNLTPMAVHATAPARYWPSAPMLNRPARNGSATATPAMSSGVTKIIVLEICSAEFSPPLQRIPRPPQTRPWYATTGSPPVPATMSPPTTNAKSTDPTGTASPRVNRRRGSGIRGMRGPAALTDEVATTTSAGCQHGVRGGHTECPPLSVS